MIGQVVAQIDDKPITTIRHNQCQLLLECENTQCVACSEYKLLLNALASKNKSSEKTLSVHTNYRYLSKAQLITEIKLLRATSVEKEIKIQKLQKLIEEGDNRLTATLNETCHVDMISIMKDHHEHVMQSYPEDSFQRTFWTTQYKMAQNKSKNGFRWNPAIIRRCIYLRHKSSSAYELLRKSNLVHLPSQRTLREYTHNIKASSGFTNELNRKLIDDAKISNLKEHEKHIGLIGDEMYVKEGLVYDKTSGDLVGYCDIGDINNHLVKLEKEYTNNTDCNRTIASTMMTLMIRGLFMNFTFPYACFPSSNLTGEQMVPIFYEAIMRLERCGFKVTCITLDGHSVN